MEQQKLFSVQEHCILIKEYTFVLFSILFQIIPNVIYLFYHTIGL